MIKFKTTILLFIVIAMSSFAYIPRSDYNNQIDIIISQYAIELKEKNGIIIYGTGRSCPNDLLDIEIVCKLKGNYSISESRGFYVEVVEEIAKRINANKSIRPYLHTFPATGDTVILRLRFYGDYDSYPDDKFISYIFSVNDKLHFNKYDMSKREYITVHKESYADALKIIQSSNKQ